MEVEAHIKGLERRMGRIARNLNRNLVCDHASTEIESPFSSRITRFSILHKFKQPHLDSYNGLGSPIDHVRTYKAQMALATNVDELLYLAFPSTLKVPAAQWFHFLKLHSISDFKKFSKQFVS